MSRIGKTARPGRALQRTADRVIDVLRDVLEAVDMLPESYAAYRPLVVDGLVFFFERLPPERLDEIFAEQAAFGDDARDDDRFVAVLRRCPTLHKLGQVLAHERGLDAALRERLQRLETLPPTADFAATAARIRAELGADARHVELADGALAEGSVAVAVPFSYASGRGIFKTLKPDAEARFREELAVWPDVAAYLEERTAHYGLPSLDYRGMLDGVGALLAREVRLDLEQDHLDEACRFYANDARVAIPARLPFCTPRLIAMERIDGTKITDPAVPLAARRRLAESAISALLARPFWQTGPVARFHADPHAGNLLATPDGRVGVVDWALVTELGDAVRGAVVRAIAGGATLDAALVVHAIASLGAVTDEAALRSHVDRALRAVRRGTFPGFDWLTGLLDDLGREAVVRFPEATTLFRKALLSLTGVAYDVDAALSVDDVLLAGGADAFARDLPLRSVAAFDSRAFRTQLSNADVTRLALALPWLPARYWLDTWRDALG